MHNKYQPAELLIRSEALIREFNFNITDNTQDRLSGYGTINDVLIRISILYNLNKVVFTHICSNTQIIKSGINNS